MKTILYFLVALNFVVTSCRDKKLANEYFEKGISKVKLNDLQGSVVDFSKAIEIDPNYAEAYTNRGNSKFNLSDRRGAIQDYSKAIKINPKYGEAYFGRGLARKILRQIDSACLDLSKAGELGYGKAYKEIKFCE